MHLYYITCIVRMWMAGNESVHNSCVCACPPKIGIRPPLASSGSCVFRSGCITLLTPLEQLSLDKLHGPWALQCTTFSFSTVLHTTSLTQLVYNYTRWSYGMHNKYPLKVIPNSLTKWVWLGAMKNGERL